MKITTPKSTPLIRLRYYLYMAIIGWTLLVCGLVWGNLRNLENHTLETAQAEARANIEKDLLYHRWATSHGGVYVPVTEDTQPNPYLNVPERDITTPSGRLLTLMNPAYIARQVDDQQLKFGILGHLTSLNPYNPDNIFRMSGKKMQISRHSFPFPLTCRPD